MLLMAAADTKDVKATGKISYESEEYSAASVRTAALKTLQFSKETLEAAKEVQAAEKARAAEEAVLAAEEAKARAEEEAIAAAEAEASQQEETKALSSERIFNISEEDYDALVRLVEAEASGEDIKGKMLVANVVLNRMENAAFPDTVKEVIYQREGGTAQFSPVASGKIDRVTVSDETKEAVERALCGEDESAGALYFVAPAYASAENRQWFENNLTLLFAYRGHEFYG